MRCTEIHVLDLSGDFDSYHISFSLNLSLSLSPTSSPILIPYLFTHPLSTNPPPGASVAVVSIPAGSDPWFGSVSPKQPCSSDEKV